MSYNREKRNARKDRKREGQEKGRSFIREKDVVGLWCVKGLACGGHTLCLLEDLLPHPSL